jgi:membrane protease YdiL (CAAX protease family)
MAVPGPGADLGSVEASAVDSGPIAEPDAGSGPLGEAIAELDAGSGLLGEPVSEPDAGPTPLPVPTTDALTDPPTAPAQERDARIGWEIVIVLGLGLGRSAIYSILAIINRLTLGPPLSEQTTSMNTSTTPDRPWLDLAYQVADTLLPLAQVLLVLYLLHLAHGHARRRIGLDFQRPGRDLAYGFAVAAAIGIPGLGFYLLARELGLNTTVAAANLSAQWWTVPALLAAALMNGLVEETVMLGYLLTRLEDRHWSPWAAIGLSALIRGTYHLYQGFGGFAGNVIMGLAFGWCYRRWGRVLPLVITHTLIDIVAFVGYAALKPHVSWL